MYRSLEEDIRSEIGASEIGKNSSDPDVYYRVSLAGVVFDRASVDEKCFECTFITRGMDDQMRMRRAVYFFDVVLFNQGIQRHKLLNGKYDDPRRVTHMMYTSMIDAYKIFSSFLEHINTEFMAYVVALDRLTELPIVHTCTPLVRRLYVKPVPIQFEMCYCMNCLKIIEGNRPQPHVCDLCRDGPHRKHSLS